MMSFGKVLNGAVYFPNPGRILGYGRMASLHRGIGRARASIRRRDDLGRVLRPVLGECLAILSLLGMIWMSTTVLLWREHAHELEEARGVSVALSEAFAETTARIISEVDQTLLSARTSYVQLGKEFDIQRWAHSQIRNDQLRVQVALMDKNGDTVRSTLATANQGKVNIADRPHFKYQLDPSRDELYISDPVLGRATKKQTIQFTRKALDQNGEFAGVFVLSLSCEELSQFYSTIGSNEGSVAVVDARSVIIASGVAHSQNVGSTVAIPSAVGQVSKEDATLFTAVTAWDRSSDELVSYQKLKRYPLTIMITRSADQIYGRYWATARNFILASSIASAITIILGIFWISQRRRAVESSRALSVTLSSVTQGIVMIDFLGRLSVVNQQARSLLRMSKRIPSGPEAERAIDQLVVAGSPSLAGLSAQPHSRETGSQILESVTEDGKAIELRITHLPDGGKVHTLTDITEQHKAQARIRYLAHHDVLTGLPNRVLLAERISSALGHATSTGQMLMVMFMDLDGFKSVNDTLGHFIGDRLLQHVAEVIETTIGPHDFVARLGGDEFTVVRSSVQDVEAALQLAPLLMDRISLPVIIDGHEVRIGASIGVSVFPQHGLDYHALFRNADIALYRAKWEGRATYRVFEPGMDERLRLEVMLEEDLRSALDAGALQVHFQPIFDCGSLDIVGFEALARWRHPTRGDIPPDTFIRIAEERSLINRLGRWVLEQACTTAATWQPPHRVAVNVSTQQLRDGGLHHDIAAILLRTGLPAELLEIEVTESVLADDNKLVMETLHALKTMGVGIVLDDFGTGYSSLSYLRRFSFDKIKIDKTFVQGQATDRGVRVILESILGMCHRLGLAVVGEGVETRQQLTMLRSCYCTSVQGNLLGLPMSAESVDELLRRNARRRDQDGASPAAPKEFELAS